MRRCIAAIAVIGLFQLFGIGQATRPAKTGGKDKYTFKPAYKPNERLLLVWRMLNESRPTAGAFAGRVARSDERYEILISVAKGRAPGQVQVRCEVVRVRVTGTTPSADKDIKVTVDSDKPETLKGDDMNAAERMIAQVVTMHRQVKVEATLADGRKLADVKVKGKFLEDPKRTFPVEANKLRKLLCTAYGRMVAIQWAYLPTSPVVIGDKWRVKRSPSALIVSFSGRSPGEFGEDVTCTLKKVSKTKAGRVAEIELAGKLTAPATLSIPPLKCSGSLQFNLDTGKLVSLQVEAVGKLMAGDTELGDVKFGTEARLGRAPDVKAKTKAAREAPTTKPQPTTRDASGPASRPVTQKDDRKVINVKTAEQLAAAIGPDRIIRLAPGTYNLSKIKQQHMKYMLWSKVHDGWEVTIRKVRNLKLEAAGEKKVSVICDPAYAHVLSFEGVANVELSGLELAHGPKTKGYCTGGVVRIKGGKNIVVRGCVLSGCGTDGLRLKDVEGLDFLKSVIKGCTYGIASIDGCSKVLFKDSAFLDNKKFYGFNIRDCVDVIFQDCRIEDNQVAGLNEPLFSVGSSSGVKVIGCKIRNNVYRGVGRSPGTG